MAELPSLPVTKLAIIGGGRMGEALLGGLLDADWPAETLAVAEVDADRRRHLEQAYPGVRAVPSPAWAVAEADAVVVAVKPADVVVSLESARSSLPPDALVLSIAAGVTIAAIEAAVPEHPVVRAMPNTAALVREGAAGIAAGTRAGAPQLDLAARILGSVGMVVTVTEAQLDAVTGVSGSGPAYVFLLAEALIDAGVAVGLPRADAHRLVVQTVLGAARLLAQDDASPETLRAAVTSPGGTTAAALLELERAGVRAAFIDAVVAATERSRELGSGG